MATTTTSNAPDLMHPGVQADLKQYLETASYARKETRAFDAVLLSDLFGFKVVSYPGTEQHNATVNGYFTSADRTIDVLMYCSSRGTYRAMTMDAVRASVEVLQRTVQELFGETGTPVQCTPPLPLTALPLIWRTTRSGPSRRLNPTPVRS